MEQLIHYHQKKNLQILYNQNHNKIQLCIHYPHLIFIIYIEQITIIIIINHNKIYKQKM